MSLKYYKLKRDFKKTPEPKSKDNNLITIKNNFQKSIFVIQKHMARNLHFDFRLQFKMVLKSWVIPKDLPLQNNLKRLAIMVEDHPIQYANFEGIIPKNNYGAGMVILWDKGIYNLFSKKNHFPIPISKTEKYLQKGLKTGYINFFLKGQRLYGKFIMFKLKKTDLNNKWIFMKYK